MPLCGPSAQEQEMQQSEQFLDTMLQSDFTQRFGQQSQTIANLNNALTAPIGGGFSPEELAARNTAAINNAAAANRNAVQAAGNAIAGQNNTSGLESGIQQQVRGQIAATEAGNLSAEQNRIIQQNYDVGRQLRTQQIAGYEALAGIENPIQYASQATEANKVGYGEAKDINSQRQQVGQMIGGLVATAAKAGLGFATGGLSNLSGDSSFGENVGNFFSGGFGALAGNGTGTPGRQATNSDIEV